MRKVLMFVMLLAAATLVMGMSAVYSQEKIEQPAANSVSAEVVAVNAEKSTLDVKVLKDAATQTYESQAIAVLPETKIIKADAVLKLSDLTAGDKVVITSVKNAYGAMTVESINVEQATPEVAK